MILLKGLLCLYILMFISYRFSGVPKEQLDQLINPIYDYLKDKNIDVFCNYYRDAHYVENRWTTKMMMAECFDHIDRSGKILCLIDTEKYSCGMLLEIGYSIAKNKEIIVCSRKGCEIKTLIEMATHHIKYENYDELLIKLKMLLNI